MPWTAIRFLAGLSVLALASTPTVADQPSFGLPLDCTPGEDCWILSYVDHDPTDGVRDYACGVATYNVPPYNRHKGTDIAIRDLQAMRDGVEVVAAADGIVIGTRDGMPDVNVRDIGLAALEGRECGNTVGINHGGGWSSQVCHLRKGSVSVRKGDRVKSGQRLGLVGLSGATEFPHVHFHVFKGKELVDPVVGLERSRPCGIGDRPLWRADVLVRLPYGPSAIFNAGFAPNKPDPEALRNGRYRDDRIPYDAPAILIWAEMFNVRKDDRLTLRIFAPNGRQMFANSYVLEKNKALRYNFGGIRRKGPAWPTGIWRGEIILERRLGPPLVAIREVEVR